MNTEKIEKLKKSLSNSKIPADLKPKIEAEIKRLEDLDAKKSEPKEEEKEVKPVAKKTTTRKPRTTKSVAKKTSTAKPSQTSKPKRTAMSVAKEIRKDGESWKDAMARASKVMKEKSKTATKDVETELQKLTKLVRGKKELKGQVGKTNLLIDAKRKAKPMGRRVSKDGNVYYENRANRTDKGTYGKYHLAEGGYLTDPNFGNFQNTMFADGGGIPNNYEGKTPEEVWNSLSVKQREHFLLDHYYVEEDEFFQQQSKWLESEDKKMVDYYSNKTWNKLSAEVKKAFTSHVKLGQYAKGGGIRRKNGQTYDYGRVWTKDHNEFDKGSDHEVNYRRKKLATGGGVGTHKYTLSEAKNMLGAEKSKNEGFSWFVSDVDYYGEDDNEQEYGVHLTDKELLDLADEVGDNYAKGGGIRRKNGQTYDYGRVWTKDHNEFDKGADHEVNYRRKKLAKGGRVESLTKELYRLQRELNSSRLQTYRLGDNSQEAKDRKKEREVKLARFNEVLKELRESDAKFELGGVMATDLAGHTGGGTGGLNAGMPLDGFSNTAYTGLVGETGAMSSGEMFMNGGGLPSGASQSYMITESLGNPAQHFAKGGGIRRKNGQTYDYGRVWTKDHNEFDKSADHEVNYRRKGKFLGVFAGGGETYNEKASQLKGGVDYYSVDIDLENGDEVRDLTFKSLDKAKKEFLKYSNSMVYDGENIDDIQLVVSFKNGDYENIYLNKGGVMATGGGFDDESPKIYVADLEAYNNGRLSGVWLDLADYNDADELMEAIQDFLKTSGGEEYAIHDVEYIPNSMYSEYMGQKDFEELYEMIDLAKQNDLPLSVVQEVISQYDASAVDEFYGKYNDAEDFAIELVDEMGIESFIDFEYYLYITDTDRRLLAQDMADSYVEGIIDEDGGNRIIEEAGLDLDEYEEAESDRQEEMIDEAREIVYDEYYNTWIEGLSDPYYFLVEEQGMYDAESFANASFVRIDFEKLADALEQDYTFIYDGGSLYVFNIR